MYDNTVMVDKAYYNKLKEQTTWISVKDRLPDNIKDVIVYDEYGLMYLAYYHPFRKYWLYVFTGKECAHKITHWMPLPEPPEIKE